LDPKFPFNKMPFEIYKLLDKQKAITASLKCGVMAYFN